MNVQIRSFRDLVVWQKSMSLVEESYKLSATFPGDERFNLTAQMRRAAVSIPSNIAEGHGRPTKGEYVQFLGIATGSLRELQTQILLCQMLGYCEAIEPSIDRCEEIAKMLYSLQKRLKS